VLSEREALAKAATLLEKSPAEFAEHNKRNETNSGWAVARRTETRDYRRLVRAGVVMSIFAR
jgi:hypothetical protein